MFTLIQHITEIYLNLDLHTEQHAIKITLNENQPARVDCRPTYHGNEFKGSAVL